MINEQEQLLELYDFITDTMNTKYPDIPAFDRDDIIQDLYLKTYTTYLAKYKDAPKHKRNAYVNRRIKYYMETILPKQEPIYLHDYLQRFPECEAYYQYDYADIINKESYDTIIHHTNKQVSERRLDMTAQHIGSKITLADIGKQYCITMEFVRMQINRTLQNFRLYIGNTNSRYFDDWFENSDIGHVYHINGLTTVTAFTTD